MVKHDLPLVNLCLLLLITLSFMLVEMASRMGCSIAFQGIEVRLTVVISWILILALFEDWGDIYFVSVLRHHSDLHKLSDMIVSSLTVVSARSLSTCGCILLGPSDLLMSSLARCSPQFSLTEEKSSFQHSITVLSLIRDP